ncbi:GhoT/OrtT family toxin, partial [Klebsiella pneumoniae]
IMGVICAVISWFLTKESRMIRLLAALLIGATWPAATRPGLPSYASCAARKC